VVDVVLLVAIVLNALQARTYYTWASGVMPGLARTGDRTFVEAIQQMNRAISRQHPAQQRHRHGGRARRDRRPGRRARGLRAGLGAAQRGPRGHLDLRHRGFAWAALA
jgi:hypothetical protein